MMTRRTAVGVLTSILALLITSLREVESADVAPVVVNAPKKNAWVGQRLPFFVELRGTGSFVGAASFSIPQVRRCVIVKVGGATVTSKEIDGKSWFLQTHEFALFSQADGEVTIPQIEVRFAHREGFTGPKVDKVGRTPAITVTIQRPPKSEKLGFVVTTKQIDITESWSPEPGKTKQGAIFRRTITQEADQVTGMALAPPPVNADEDIRIYPGRPEVSDDTERGAFRGRRRDTITYVVRGTGTLTVPAIQYVWWDPETKKYGTRTLPGVTFQVPVPPRPVAAETDSSSAGEGNVWIWTAGVLLLLAFVGCGHRRIAAWCRRGWRSLNPPERVAARALMRASRENDAPAASSAWQRWRGTKPIDYEPSPALMTEIVALERCLFGGDDPTHWNGDGLISAFRNEQRGQAPSKSHRCELPTLNPVGTSVNASTSVDSDAS